MKLKILAIFALLTSLGSTLPVAAIETANPQANAEVMLLSQGGWREYGSERFTIRMPGEPVSSRNSEEIAEGFTLTFNEMTFEDNNGAYGLIYTDLPSNYMQDTNAQEVLNDMSALFLISTQLEGLKELEKSINLKGHPGLEYRISEPEAALVLRLYLVQQRVYFLFGVSERENQVNQFVNSFNLR